MKAISKKSRKKARKKTKMLTKIRKPTCAAGQAREQVLDPAAAVDALEHQAETVAPIRMKITIAVMRMVDVHAPAAPAARSGGRCSAASTMAPTAPIAPASVGVARPRKIVPSTRKISTSDGTMPHSTLRISGQPRSVRASGGSGGTDVGRKIDDARR